jgi:hypothetical protein
MTDEEKRKRLWKRVIVTTRSRPKHTSHSSARPKRIIQLSQTINQDHQRKTCN